MSIKNITVIVENMESKQASFTFLLGKCETLFFFKSVQFSALLLHATGRKVYPLG